MKQYEHQLAVRKRNWMDQLSLANVERVQYDQTLDAIHVGLGNAYAALQEQFRDQIGEALQQDEAGWQEFMQNNKSASLAASGRTGRSVDRISAVELGQYLRQGSRRAYELTKTRRKVDQGMAQAAAEAQHARMEAFAKINVVRNPGLAPPKPVMQKPKSAWQQALGIGGQVIQTAMSVAGPIMIAGAGSDRRMKENIKKIGDAISGLGIYKFNYIGNPKQYIGAMADEVMKVKPEAVVTMDNGFFGVRYDLIDVQFKEATA